MYIIIIPLSDGKESYYKRGYVGKLPRTMDRHSCTQFKSESYANTIANGLNVKHMDKAFTVESY